MTDTANMVGGRRRTLSLRALIVVVLIVGGCLGWVAHLTRGARMQRAAVARIQGVGGGAMYEWEWRDGKPLPPGSPCPVPKWLLSVLGPDYFGNVVAVNLFGRRQSADDALMVYVGRLRHLEELSLFNTAVTDAGLAHLQGLTRLKTLHLHQTGVRGPGLAALSGMVELEDLKLPWFPITDAELAHLSGLTKLKRVALNSNRLTNEGLVHLRDMRQLETLELYATKITSLEPIRGCTNLKYLWLQGSSIDDGGLKPIAGFRNLELLALGRTKVTDAGLDTLCSLPRLWMLDLDRTRITDAGLDRLTRIPGLKSLNLYSTEVTDAGLDRMAKSGGLKSCQNLVVSGPEVTLVGLDSLHAKLPTTQVVGPDLDFTKGPSKPIK